MFKVGDEVQRIGGNGRPCKVLGYDQSTNYLWLQPIDLILKHKPFTESANQFKLRELRVGDIVEVRDVKASWRICAFDGPHNLHRFAWIQRLLESTIGPVRSDDYASVEVSELRRVRNTKE